MIQPPTSRQAAEYYERLRTPWWWYLVAIGVSVLLGLEFAVAVSGWLAWIPLALLLPLSLLVVWRLSSGSLAIVDGTLRAGDRQLELSRVQLAIDLSSTELRRLVGRHGDPLAYTFIRSWVGPGAQLVLRPPTGEPAEDRLPEPYWLVSTRQPDRLLAAIRAATEEK